MVTVGLGGTAAPLKSRDQLRIGEQFAITHMEEKALPAWYIPKFINPICARVIWGPQSDYFSPETLNIFLNSEYTITPQSDRQGYRLKGQNYPYKII